MLYRLTEIDIPGALSSVMPRWATQLCVALILIAIVVLLRLGVDRVAPGTAPFALMFPAIVLACSIAGARAGVFTLIIGGALSWYVVIPPERSFAIQDAASAMTLGLFIISAVLVIIVADAFRSTARQIARERQALHESEERFRLVAENAPINLWMGDETGKCVYLNRAQREFWGVGEDLADFSWNDRLLPADRVGLFAVFTDAMREERAFEAEARYYRADGAIRILATKAQPRRDINGVFLGMIGVNVDITDGRGAERHQRLLIDELNHRVKNTLATVQSLAYQTIRGENIAAKTEDFFGRLVALSAAHDVLTRENWETVLLKDVVAEALRPFDVGDRIRFIVSGPDVRLTPRLALSLSMALHELSTNAVKYGALTGDEGVVEIAWSEAPEGGARLEWRERGGPPVKPPTRRGFGTRLLQDGLTGDLRSRPVLSYGKDGVSCQFELPSQADAQE